MNITLDQLKEIAKAGYGVKKLIWCDYDAEGTDIIILEERSDYCVYKLRASMLSLLPPKTTIGWSTCFSIHISKDKGLVNLYSSNYPTLTPFNHLTAIRKMEELGLIEK